MDLAAIAATLGVPLARFFEDLPDPDQRSHGRPDVPLADQLLATEQGMSALANGEDMPGDDVH